MVCIYTNADSLLNKIDELTALASLKEPDIIMITEILPKNVQTAVQVSELDIKGYDFHSNLDDPSCRRGVCIYTKSYLGAAEIKMDVSVKESTWCELKLKASDKLLVGCIYRSPNASSEENAKVNELIKSAAKMRYSHVLIGGDFNHPELDWYNGKTTKNPEHKSSLFLEAVRDSFLFQHVKDPTHYRCDQTPSTIDLLFTNEDNMLSNLHHNTPIGKSHHVSLVFDLNCYTLHDELTREHYQYYKGDYDEIRARFDSSELVNKMQNKSAEECWNLIDHQLRELQRLFIPKIRIGKNKRIRPLWMNANAMAKVKKKWHAFKRYRETREWQDQQQYVRARNQTKWAVRQAKKAYETSITKEVKRNPKVFFKYAKSKLKTRSGIADLIKENGEKTKSTQEKAEVLNNFFASIFTQESVEQIPDFETRCNTILNNILITEVNVIEKIKKLRVSKTPGPDGHHPRLLRELLDSTFPKALCILFKKSLEEGWLPQIWRNANVSPIYKQKGSKNNATNYRPVSLTCIICKLMESLLRDELMEYMFNNNLFSPVQHGFLEARSCVTQLIAVMDKWSEIIDEGGSIDTVYLDFQKAFDTVPHIRLFNKLRSYGITGKVLEWIQAFLSNRRQRVMVDGGYSSWKEVTSGIPQGSILGPFLFVLFINDLPDYLTNFVYMFADDTKVFAKVTNDEEHQRLQDDLDKLCEWSSTWQLKFNISKCKVMHLGNDNNLFRYYMGADADKLELEATSVEKDLGVNVDKDLNFDHHITECVKAANKTLGLIRRTYQHLDPDTLKTLYVALVRPKLEYGNV